MKIKQTDLITVPRSRKPGHCHFLGGSDARVIMSLDEAGADPDCGPAITAVLTPPNRQRRRLCSCGPFGASTRELARNNGRPLQNYRLS